MNILIIEQNLSFARKLQIALINSNYHVDIKKNGLEALLQVAQTPYDLILINPKTSEISGIKLLNKIRAKLSNCKIIILGTHKSTTTILNYLKNGANDFIAHPFTISELIARIKTLKVNQSYQDYDLVFNHNGYTFNQTNSSLDYKERTINLTRIEREILFELFRAKGNTVDYEFIIKKIWLNKQNKNKLNILNAHMTYLRNKTLTLTTQKILIKTVRQKGYKLA